MTAGPDASSDRELTSPARTDETASGHESDAGTQADPFDERDLQPAVRRQDADEGGVGRRDADERGVGRRDADPEGVTDAVSPSGPLEPQEIDPENAAFVLLGVLLVVGFVVVTIAGF